MSKEKKIRFLIVSYAIHKTTDGAWYSYAPYVREMNLWLKHVDEVVVVAPLDEGMPDALDLSYVHPKLKFVRVPKIDFTTRDKAIKSALNLPFVLWVIFRYMIWANHIHLRCPGNLGLLGVIAQMFFPFKRKTIKYANNWDWRSKQAKSYRWQQHILRSDWFTHRAKVLVYGDWNEKSRNIVPFYTASYTNSDKLPVEIRELSSNQVIELIFVGTITANKRPLTALKTLAILNSKGYNCRLTVIGGGYQLKEMVEAAEAMGLSDRLVVTGKISPQEVVGHLSKAHFLVFMSMSEGWPKVVAEAMWWGCVPISTDVSCVKSMLGHGSRGIIVEPKAEQVANTIVGFMDKPEDYRQMAQAGLEWAREYTLERFESDIVKFLK
jgi:glycosyltransferase involved in cell wall biosynthesis